MTSFDIGDRPRLTCEFTDLVGAPADPTAVTFSVRSPSGAVSVETPTRETTGIYYADLTLTAAGDWRYRFEGTGALVAAAEGILSVRRSSFS